MLYTANGRRGGSLAGRGLPSNPRRTRPSPPTSPLPHFPPAFYDYRANVTYNAGLYLTTVANVPPLKITNTKIDVAIASGNNTFAQSVVFQVRTSGTPTRGGRQQRPGVQFASRFHSGHLMAGCIATQ
jgi:hypothetical protein